MNKNKKFAILMGALLSAPVLAGESKGNGNSPNANRLLPLMIRL